jgi:putative sterol carrier protein
MASQQEVAELFANMAQTVDSSKIEDVDATIQFDLSGDNGGQYWVKMANGSVESGEGALENPSMTLKASADDWAAMVNGELNAMQAFMSGKVKIQGNMGLAMKLQTLIGT